MSDTHRLRSNRLALIPRFQHNLINREATPAVVRRARSRRDGASGSGAFTVSACWRSPCSGRRLLRSKSSARRGWWLLGEGNKGEILVTEVRGTYIGGQCVAA
jgi:hypothetical protein